MSTKIRINIPGGLHHIMSRGIGGRAIFSDDDSKRFLLGQLSASLEASGHRCYAWAVMDNHYHLVLRAGDEPLHRMMRCLNMRFARYYAKKTQSSGYVFQGRFKSIATQDQGYLEELIRYVHLNPVRAGICRDLTALDRYPWCGHAVLMSHAQSDFQNTDDVLKRFGDTSAKARTAYRDFIQAGLTGKGGEDLWERVRDSNNEAHRTAEPHCWVIGDPDFVRDAVRRSTDRRLRISRCKAEGSTLETLSAGIAEELDIQPSGLKHRSRLAAASTARKVLSYVACSLLDFSQVEVAAYLGVSPQSVSAAKAAGKDLFTGRQWPKLINLVRG